MKVEAADEQLNVLRNNCNCRTTTRRNAKPSRTCALTDARAHTPRLACQSELADSDSAEFRSKLGSARLGSAQLNSAQLNATQLAADSNSNSNSRSARLPGTRNGSVRWTRAIGAVLPGGLQRASSAFAKLNELSAARLNSAASLGKILMLSAQPPA